MALILILVPAFSACGGNTPAETTTAEDTDNGTPLDGEEYFVFEEEEYEGDKYYVLKGTTDAGKKQKTLEVPEEYKGLRVLSLDSKCFEGCDKLETLTLHSNIRELYDNLFPGCKSLKTINLDFGDLVKAIKEDPSVADTMTCATAGDGSITGKNSIIEGLDEKKVKMVFTDNDAYDYFSSDYTWAVFADIMTLAK